MTSSQQLRELYEGEDYVGRYHSEPGERLTRLVDLIGFEKNDKVLDIGCGNGLLLPLIDGKVKEYDGVDFSKAFIKQAKEKAKTAEVKTKHAYYAEDVIEFCKTHKGFTKVLALDFTEHINDEELLAIFGAVRKSMSPGGKAYIHTPNKDFVLERIKSDHQKIEVQGHIALRNATEYRELFKKAGFRKVKVTPLSHYIQALRPLHLLSFIPVSPISSLFQARLLIECEN